MDVLLLLLMILVVAVLVWLWVRRRKYPQTGQASDAALGITPTKVILPDESEPEERSARQRTGETQELRRKVVHGPYRAVGDRGEPSDVPMSSKS